MNPDQLYVITPVSNPLRFKSRVHLTKLYVERMRVAGVHLILVEAQLGERPFEFEHLAGGLISHIGVRYTTIVWHKESLINIGLSRLPVHAKYIAWIDGDITFRNPHWAVDTLHALQQWRVIQPWEHAYDTGPHGEHLDIHTSFCSLYRRHKPIAPPHHPPYKFGHPGYAWAIKREVLDGLGGLYQDAALGSADHNMAMSMINRVSWPQDISASFNASQLAWRDRALATIDARLGYISGSIEHGFHGPKVKRGYVSRWDILRRAKFDPCTDLRRNLYGVIELTGNKPQLRSDIEAYFAARDEDSNQAEV